MGFIDENDLPDRNQPNGVAELSRPVDSDGFRCFHATDLAPEVSTPTGMKEDVVLLAWLIVLMRTREGTLPRFEWAYNSRSDADVKSVHNQLPTENVVPGLDSSVEQIATAISQYIKSTTPVELGDAPNSASLILSSGSLTYDAEANEEGAMHFEVRFEHDQLHIRPVWQTDNMLQHTVKHTVEQFADTIKACLLNPGATIEQSLKPVACDIEEIWRLNHELPPLYSFGTHELFSERAKQIPDKVAIDSWDGQLTYGEIEQWSSYTAWKLKEEMGVQLNDVLPVCFEKSKWTIVAVLAVMKVGATFALMDPTLPLARLQNMAKQVGAKAMVSSRNQHEFSAEIMPSDKIFIVEADAFANLSRTEVIAALPTVPPQTLMYIIFTSGSTGTPKGVTISHETYTSSCIPRSEAVGYKEDSRVLDFASYAFDVSIDSMLCTLTKGGTLCIPSDEDRLNDINEVIRNMKINYAGMTPSVARILDPDVIKSLTNGLGLGGEAVPARDANIWGQDARIIIGYGPCECTIGCTINSSAATGRDYLSIGPGNGAAMWIVDPNDHDQLMPIGAVGELLVEGPIVGQGYLGDPEKTASVFIESPPWLAAGYKCHPGRKSRLYKTGDLGRYDPDGSGGIVFAGRKDTQVKLRGQRVELGEIESQLRAILPTDSNVIAEVIVPQGTGGQATLIAFVTTPSMKDQGGPGVTSAEPSDDLREILPNLSTELAKVVPRYMVPTAYIPVNEIPVLISGKTDRKQLRAFGATIDLRQLDSGNEAMANRELSDLEKHLRDVWAQTLKLDAEGIKPNDNFFALGGDSVAAMKLVSVCRSQGLDLSVTGMFGNPSLAAMASVVEILDGGAAIQTEAPAFSMISQPAASACAEASEVYGFKKTAIEDIYPCTPTQESLFTFSLKSVKPYVAQRVATIPSNIEVTAWKAAWEKVVTNSPILRTRLAQLQEPGLQQVVLQDTIYWRNSDNLEAYLEKDRNDRMQLGDRLARYAIVEDNGKRYMVWTIHHVVYDGWSEPLVLHQVSNALKYQPVNIQTQMREFVRWVKDTDESAMEEFWRRELKNAVGPQFPRLPSRDFVPHPDGNVEHSVSVQTGAGYPFTLATLIRGAWALVSSQYSGSDDVVFGETLTGRDISLPGVEGIVGPLIATVPVRIRINRQTTIESFLQAVQSGVLARSPYQHMGMQNIRKVSRDAQHACEAPTGLVIQPDPDSAAVGELGFALGDVVREALHFNPYPLMIGCGIRKGGFRIRANFDSTLIQAPQMKRVLAQMEAACFQLTRNLSRRLDEISCIPSTELNQIWQWNETPPLSLDESTHTLRANSSIKAGSSYPSAVVPWVVDVRNSSLLSPIGCVGELWLEGAILSGETVDSPAWLVAGSSACGGRAGKVQPTGDIVRLQEDGTLVFVGRKENLLPVEGHAVNIAELETHFTSYLPPTVRAATAVIQSAEGQNDQPELIVLLQPRASKEKTVEIMFEKHEIGSKGCKATTCTAVTSSLALGLKKLDKFIRDSLPTYLAPSAYVVIEEFPEESEEVDYQTVLNQLATSIPTHVLEKLREGFQEAWKKTSAQANLTPKENILRTAWANILRMEPKKIDLDDNFFRLGGDSVLAMKLVSSLRAQGHGLTVADIFQHMRLGDAARVLKLDQASQQNIKPYKPFSTLDQSNLDSFISDIVRPKLANPQWSIHDVTPVTDSQVVDIKATVNTPRTAIQYTMLFFEEGVDREKLFHACDKLIKTHEILRTVFIEHESKLYQVVLNEMETPLTKHLADEDLEKSVKEVCAAHVELDFKLGSSFLQVIHVEGRNGSDCLILGLSHAQYDGVSLPKVLEDLETFYIGGEPAAHVPFSVYMGRVSDERVQKTATNYWGNLLRGSSLSVLEGTSVKPGDKGVFKTKTVEHAQPLEYITTATLLTAAWALVLARRLRKSDVTFGGVTSGRSIDLPNVENIAGPCYQLTPIRVLFESHWTAMDLLQYVQKQSAESAAYDFLGFEKISQQVGWSTGHFYDSLVHHQDWDDFDTMPFAGGICKVDILNPHGDSPYPMKVVSFVKEGKVNVGLVGSENDSLFVDEALDELAATVQELSGQKVEALLDAEIF
ncbi:hypothetical protein N7520_004094 [Penicillium odoratum]|uniref:uncharacterized protein n=1 Tax=Penicillium odoratum TaxID=1167516 RepID=UPI0025471810|nr:uncharacterized protein N7520_004094 [Penicillium odoratum]KAJ5769535.1 hypothetical protein N7520_004094 [Penicillium odoratum]